MSSSSEPPRRSNSNAGSSSRKSGSASLRETLDKGKRSSSRRGPGSSSSSRVSNGSDEHRSATSSVGDASGSSGTKHRSRISSRDHHGSHGHHHHHRRHRDDRTVTSSTSQNSGESSRRKVHREASGSSDPSRSSRRSDRERSSSKSGRRKKREGGERSRRHRSKSSNNTTSSSEDALELSDHMTSEDDDDILDLDEETKTTTTKTDADFGASEAAFSAFDQSMAPDFGASSAFGASTALDGISPTKLSRSQALQTTGFGGFTDFGASGFPSMSGAAADTAFPSDFAPAVTYDTSPIQEPPIPKEALGIPASFVKLKSPRPIWVQAKPSTAAPIANPLSGNVLMVRPKPHPILGTRVSNQNAEWQIVEWDPNTQAQVMTATILSPELQRKVTQKFKVTLRSLESVLTLAAGVHQVNGYTRSRVACLMDLRVDHAQGQNELLRIIGIWQWGYGTNQACQLQTVINPPSGNDFTFDPQSLLVADSCVFLSGAGQKGPCVFLSKPTVKDTWSANFVGKDSSRITAMALIAAPIHPRETSSKGAGPNTKMNLQAQPPRIPYLAIGMSDGSLSVWTYEAATKITSKTTETAKRLLYPLCRLEGSKSLESAQPSAAWKTKDGSEETVGQCTHLQWVPPRATAHNQLLLLAACFQGGLCLFHVALPKIQDKSNPSKGSVYVEMKAPTEKTQLSQTYSLKPFSLLRWKATYSQVYASFCDLGPHLPPSLTVLALEPKFARMTLVVCPFAMHGRLKSKDSEEWTTMEIWDSQDFEDDGKEEPRGLIPCSSVSGGTSYRTDTQFKFFALQESSNRMPGRGGIGSLPVGLSTSGTFCWSDATADGDKAGIWHVYTTLHCDRKKKGEYLVWTPPTRRHWLIRTMIGDCKASGADEAKKEEKDQDEVVTSGTVSKVVCELKGGELGSKLSSYVPYKVLRHPTRSSVGAVWFRPLGNTSSKKDVIGIIDSGPDSSKIAVTQLVEGRDVAFLPDTSDGIPQCAVLSENGGQMELWQKNPSWAPTKTDQSSFRPIVGVEETSADDYVDCQAIHAIYEPALDQIGLLSVGFQSSKGQHCLIKGQLEDSKAFSLHGVLPNIKKHHVLWLKKDEGVMQIVSLPSEGSLVGGLGVITSKRVLILSLELDILSSHPVKVPPTSLVVMGSYTVAFVSQDDCKIRYLSGLPGTFGSSGIIASLPLPQYGYNPSWLIGIRPDRLVFTSYHAGTRMVERGQDSNAILVPASTTRPALLLEPMIANAIATGKDTTSEQPFFRTVVEKFGRKVATMTHGESEGIGNLGAGITPRVYELLEHYNLQAAASWLLTGTTRFDRGANSRLLPTWMPMLSKVKGAPSSDTHLHVVANGDQYLSEYVKSPDTNMTATLPRPTDPSSLLCQSFGEDFLTKGQALDAAKMLDLAGSEKSEKMLLEMALALNTTKDTNAILSGLFQSDSQIGSTSESSSVASLAALAVELKQRQGGGVDETFRNKWMHSLAPSVQRGRKMSRLRPRIFGETALKAIGTSQFPNDQLFSSETNESRLVWNEGPNREKENLLILDHIQEWFGRYRPVVLGKEGVKAAEDQGANILADILQKQDDDSFGGDDQDDLEDGWVDGVGEGQKSEDKLSMYYRFSEGEDEESAWREEGFADLSKYEVKAILVGCNDTALLEESTSSVDVGDPGKVKAIFDLVFEQSGVGIASALAVPASRGGSLDVGMMHGPDQTSRQKCSIEFWFWVPEKIEQEVILVRRTFGSSADDFENSCKASEKESSLWELALSSNGELEFRSVSGGKLKSEPKGSSDDDDDDGPKSTIQMSRWNHVCMTFKQDSTMTSAVNLFVKGASIGTAILSFKPPNVEDDEFAGASGLDSILEKSHLVFGLNHPASFRLTEMRVWAMERDDDDIRNMMKEYLEPAEIKRKFLVKIKKKGGNTGSGKFGLAPPKSGLAPPRKSGLAPPSGFAPPPGSSLAPPKGTLAPPKGTLAPPAGPDKPARKGLLAPPKGSEDIAKAPTPKADEGFAGFEKSATPTSAVATEGFDATTTTPTSVSATDAPFGGEAFGGFGDEAIPEVNSAPTASFDSGFGQVGSFPGTDASPGFEAMDPMLSAETDDTYGGEVEISPLWDSAIPLSEQVRSSAAAALIRGPPATRHFGGNRGGLPDYRELDRFGVGAISICGSEKTIVWRDDQVPPGLTYPIGASGAIVSDQMDEDGSEFLCCFLAKDKRMVVFELSTRTVVVELQMTTKLNYWRFLPPEAGEDTLCFMLVTPVGGFHWMPLDESPRPRQVWKRGPELQGKKIVSYEEGGTNGLDGPDMLSKVGMLLVTNAKAGGRLEAWLIPICGDSQAVCASDNMLGGCLCHPPDVAYEAWMPLLLFVVGSEEGDLIVCISAVTETTPTSVGLTDVMTDAVIEMAPYADMDFEPPTLAMGTWPEVLCCSLGSTIVIIARRKGLVVAYELADTGLELIAQENVGHFVVDAVMRYSAVEGGAEIVLLMSDSENPRDGRVGTFCFRTTL